MTVIFGTALRSDGDALGEVAGLLSRRRGEPLRLVHASEDPRAPFVLGTDEERLLGAVRSALNAEAAKIAALTGAQVEPHLAAGPVVDALVAVAEWELASVVVLGAGSGRSRNPFGGTVERVSRKSRAPVLALRDPGRLTGWLRGKGTLRILVGADFGLAAGEARAFAAQLGALGPSEVHVVLVASPAEQHARLGLPPPASEHALSEEAAAALLRDLGRSAPAGDPPERLRVVAGRGLADAHLVTLADQEGFDLVIVGQRRHSAIEQIWYGSVARGVLRAAPMSVACIPSPEGRAGASFRPPRVVVVATDFSDAGDGALAHAVGHAVEGATVHVAHVLPKATATTAELIAARERAWHRLGLVCRGDIPERSIALEKHVLDGDAAEQLVALSERVGADLLVLGSGKRSALSRAVLGSVARAVVEASRVPVLLVPLAPV